MLKFLMSALLALGFAAPLAQAGSFANYCAWAPHHPEVCAARKFCTPNPANSRCAVYCHVNPRDVVCGEVYQKPLAPTPPRWFSSPYPWANHGSFCQENPGNPACENDWFLDY